MSQLKTTSLSHKDNNTGTPNITMYPDGTTSLNYAATGFKNQLINGDFRVWQRSVDFDNTSGTESYGGPDRFVVAANSRVRRQSGPNPPSGFGVIAWLTRAASGTLLLRQALELDQVGVAGQFSSGSQWTLRVWTTVANAADVNFNVSFSDDNAVPANTSQVIPNTTAVATGRSDSSGKATFYEYSLPITINVAPNSTNTSLLVAAVLTNQTDASVAGFSMEPGPVCTPMEIRPIGIELALCQRYYFQVNTVPGGKAGSPTIPGIGVVVRDTTNYLTLPALDQMRTSGMRTLANVTFHGPLLNAQKGANPSNDNEWTCWYSGQGSGYKTSTGLWQVGSDNNAIYGIYISVPSFATSLRVGMTPGQKVISLDAEL